MRSDRRQPEHDARWRRDPWRPFRGSKPRPSGGAGVREPREPSPRTDGAAPRRAER